MNKQDIDCMEAIVRQNDGGPLREPKLAYDDWRATIRHYCGRFHPEGIEPKAFVGRVGARKTCGLCTLDVACNAGRIERTQRDVRMDGVENYYAVFQVAGQTTMTHNDDIIGLRAGDIVLVDATRPVTAIFKNKDSRWLSLHLPRQALVSHLGFEPRGGLSAHGSTLAARLLLQLSQHIPEVGGSTSGPADSYLHLAIYDLLGALFTPDQQTVSAHTDKLFDRIRSIVMARFAEPDLGPADVAAEAGISLRYLQKLFTIRGDSCSHFIQSVRLEHAARLLHRLEWLETGQPLSEIARTVGFRDYAHFSRSFRIRFGRPPSAHTSGPREKSDQEK